MAAGLMTGADGTMNALQWTAPPELTTGVTNLIIVVTCIVCLTRMIRIKQDEKLRSLFWILLFAIMIPTGIYGFIVHAFVMPPETKRIAWIFLSFLLGLTTTCLAVSLLFEILGRAYLKPILMINGAAELLFAVIICFLSKKVPNIHFIFFAYTGIVFVIVLLFLIRLRRERPHFWWYMIAILTVVIGGLFEACGDFTVSVIWKFDQGSACHLAIAAALCLFAAGFCRGAVRSRCPA